MKASASASLRKAWKSTTGGSVEMSSGFRSRNSNMTRSKVAFIIPGERAGSIEASRGQRTLYSASEAASFFSCAARASGEHE